MPLDLDEYFNRRLSVYNRYFFLHISPRKGGPYTNQRLVSRDLKVRRYLKVQRKKL